MIGVDAYRQPYIPFYLTTKEFFTEVSDHLTPRGVVIINVGHPEGSDALEKVLGDAAVGVPPRRAGADRGHEHAADDWWRTWPGHGGDDSDRRGFRPSYRQ